MDVERERLLLTRADELRREYENLVRSLEAAQEAVKATNHALAENRAESRRVFQECLALTASPRPAPTAPPFPFTSSSAPTTTTTKRQTLGTITRPQTLQKILGTRRGDDRESASLPAALPMVTLHRQDDTSPGGSDDISRIIAYSLPRSDSVTRNSEPSDAIAPSLIYAEQRQQSSAPTVYVGNEHSYAVNDGCDEQEIDIKEKEKVIDGGARQSSEENEQPPPAVLTSPPSLTISRDALVGAAAVTTYSEWRALFRSEICEDELRIKEDVVSNDIDLSIVKNEWPDESNETSNPMQMSDACDMVPPNKISTRSIPGLPKRNRIPNSRYKTEMQNLTEDEVKRRRRQTRDRMRRWRARKRLEQLTNKSVRCRVKLGSVQM